MKNKSLIWIVNILLSNLISQLNFYNAFIHSNQPELRLGSLAL